MSNYRNRRNYENLERQIFDGVGKYGIPQIEPVTSVSYTHLDVYKRQDC